MKKMMLLTMLLSLGSFGWAGEGHQDATDRLNNAGKVLHEIMSAPDKGIPEEVLEHAKCVAVVPNMIKGGFVFGGKHGKGVATCRTASCWTVSSSRIAANATLALNAASCFRLFVFIALLLSSWSRAEY